MLLLIGFAFLGGIVTILSPCILPVLPIILSGSIAEGKRRPLGIITGFILSFTFFTLFLTAVVNATGIPADSLRTVAIVILIVFGLTLLIPPLQKKIEVLFSRLASRGQSNTERHGFVGGLIIGLSLGLLWTPCVGPILASVISLALTGSVTGAAALITLAYALGTAIPMFAIMIGGRTLMKKVPWLLNNAARIQQIFGVLMILTAVAIVFNVDRKIQTYILDRIPSYGAGLTSIEDNDAVKQQLDSLDADTSLTPIGQPMFDMNETGTLAPEIISGGEWFNSGPLTLAELKNKKVVLVDFWTYSCINCIRTLPYLNDWYEKYKDDGLEIIAVHTPEFEFEKDPDNVRQAIEEYNIKYPVVQDNEYATWRAYANRYWPRKYLIDINGNIVYDHIGEGAYEETEKKIQELLEEVTNKKIADSFSEPNNVITKTNSPTTPELYFGALRNERAGNYTPGITGTDTFEIPPTLEPDLIYLRGTWTVSTEFVENKDVDARIMLQFGSQNIYLVASALQPVMLTVRIDGEIVNTITVQDEKLYTLFEGGEFTDGILTLDIENPGLQAFAFTFG